MPDKTEAIAFFWVGRNESNPNVFLSTFFALVNRFVSVDIRVILQQYRYKKRRMFYFPRIDAALACAFLNV